MEHQELTEKLNRVNLKVKSGLNYSTSEMIDDLIQSIQPNGGDRVVSENEKQKKFVACDDCDEPYECEIIGCDLIQWKGTCNK